MAHTIVHFEIPSDNIERAKKFYNDLFGRQMETMPGPMDYWMLPQPIARRANNQRRCDGNKMPNELITIYIDVKSVNEYAKKL